MRIPKSTYLILKIIVSGVFVFGQCSVLVSVWREMDSPFFTLASLTVTSLIGTGFLLAALWGVLDRISFE